MCWSHIDAFRLSLTGGGNTPNRPGSRRTLRPDAAALARNATTDVQQYLTKVNMMQYAEKLRWGQRLLLF